MLCARGVPRRLLEANSIKRVFLVSWWSQESSVYESRVTRRYDVFAVFVQTNPRLARICGAADLWIPSLRVISIGSTKEFDPSPSLQKRPPVHHQPPWRNRLPSGRHAWMTSRASASAPVETSRLALLSIAIGLLMKNVENLSHIVTSHSSAPVFHRYCAFFCVRPSHNLTQSMNNHNLTQSNSSSHSPTFGSNGVFPASACLSLLPRVSCLVFSSAWRF